MGDDAEHHIDARCTARAREAIAVDLEKLVGHLDLGEILSEAGQILPMDGTAIPVEQTGTSEDMTGRAHRSHIRALARHLAQPRQSAFVRKLVHVDATANDDNGHVVGFIQITFGLQDDAVRCRDRRTIHGIYVPCVKVLAAGAVRQAQSLHHRHDRIHRKIRK